MEMIYEFTENGSPDANIFKGLLNVQTEDLRLWWCLAYNGQ